MGRYAYEMISRTKGQGEFAIVDSSAEYGDTLFDKVSFLLSKRRRYLNLNLNPRSAVNHFLQNEIFFRIGKGSNIVTFHNPPPFTAHNSFHEIKNDMVSLSTSIFYYRRYDEALRTCDYIVANSEFTKDGIIERGVDEGRIKVTYGGVSNAFTVVTPHQERRNRIGYVGSFAVHKRVGKLLEDVVRHEDSLGGYEIELYGSKGVLFKDLKERYDRKAGIIFKGPVLPENIVTTMNSFKALIMPTKWETFGLPIIEAVACGTPVFVYPDADITPEVRRFTIEIEEIAALPELLESIDQQRLNEMSARVRREFSWDSHFNTMLGIYKELGGLESD